MHTSTRRQPQLGRSGSGSSPSVHEARLSLELRRTGGVVLLSLPRYSQPVVHTPHAWITRLLAGALSAGCVTEDVVGRIVETSPSEAPSAESTEEGAQQSTEAGADSSLSPAACSGILCANFETPLTSELVRANEQASVDRDCSMSQQGTCGLRVSLLEGGGQATWRSEFPPLGEVHVRVWLWVPEAESIDDIDDIAILHLGEPGTNTGLNLDLRSDGRFEVFLVEEQVSVLSEAETLVRGDWSCLQVSVTERDNSSSVQLYVDEALAASASASTLFTDDGAASLLTAGVDWSAQDQQPFEFWLDALALDERPIPCSNVR